MIVRASVRLALTLLLAAACLACGPPRRAGVETLVEQETRFATAAKKRGIRNAFLQFMAEDGILFRPGPVAARSWLEENKDMDGLLNWRPVVAAIAASGDLGFTLGPWEFSTPARATEPIDCGHYVTVWSRQADGSLKAAIDAGVSHASCGTELTKSMEEPAASWTADPSGMEGRFDELVAIDGRITGPPSTLLDHAAEGLLLLRERHAPAVGRAAAREILSSPERTSESRTGGGKLSASQDLAFTYGVIESASGTETLRSSSYLRIWRRGPDGSWSLVVDLEKPIPAG